MRCEKEVIHWGAYGVMGTDGTGGLWRLVVLSGYGRACIDVYGTLRGHQLLCRID